ncbi:hypothetical protein [Streptomyces sp. NPDC086519]|uniref:hypothetical protein n=1 Tax=Streptomyces sp. NPDC086519 TaxID=3154863 RepID=UPI003442FAAE
MPTSRTHDVPDGTRRPPFSPAEGRPGPHAPRPADVDAGLPTAVGRCLEQIVDERRAGAVAHQAERFGVRSVRPPAGAVLREPPAGRSRKSPRAVGRRFDPDVRAAGGGRELPRTGRGRR